jgi:ADP-ribosylglycohydrolase
MHGAIIGDIVGSRFERGHWKGKEFVLFTPDSHFTDDTVMTFAVADWLLYGRDLVSCMRAWGRQYPLAGYGGNFKIWLTGIKNGPYGSWGNGSAMRVSPVGWGASSLEECMQLAEASAIVTHDHPEGIKGAQAVAGAIFLARTGAGKADIKDWVQSEMQYDLDRNLEDIRPEYTFDVSCRGSVPEAIIAFLESSDLEDAIRNAVSLGGDTDTLACMAGSIAEAYYHRKEEMDEKLLDTTYRLLPESMKTILREFYKRYKN